MTPEELQEAKQKWNKIAGRTYGIIDNFAINREIAPVINIIPDLHEHIESLQAEICKKESQKNEFYASLQDALSLIERMSDEKEAKDARIKDLEQRLVKKDQELAQLREESETRRKIGSDAMIAIDRLNGKLAEQRAYIGRLETAYVEMVFSATGSDEESKEALEKLKG